VCGVRVVRTLLHVTIEVPAEEREGAFGPSSDCIHTVEIVRRYNSCSTSLVWLQRVRAYSVVHFRELGWQKCMQSSTPSHVRAKHTASGTFLFVLDSRYNRHSCWIIQR
jgi:hypothetical protein